MWRRSWVGGKKKRGMRRRLMFVDVEMMKLSCWDKRSSKEEGKKKRKKRGKREKKNEGGKKKKKKN